MTVYKRLIALAASLALLVGATGCATQPTDPAASPTTVPSELTQVTNTPADVPIADAEVLYETPYITVVRPDFWDNRIAVTGIDGVGKYTLNFKTTVNDKEATLFSFTFGENGNGYRLGQMTDSSGETVWVYSEIGVFEAGDLWTEEEAQTLNALQECVNEILAQIQTAENFVA